VPKRRATIGRPCDLRHDLGNRRFKIETTTIGENSRDQARNRFRRRHDDMRRMRRHAVIVGFIDDPAIVQDHERIRRRRGEKSGEIQCAVFRREAKAIQRTRRGGERAHIVRRAGDRRRRDQLVHMLERPLVKGRRTPVRKSGAGHRRRVHR
jgi:hypothetical protein